jgi:hypothetical protein
MFKKPGLLLFLSSLSLLILLVIRPLIDIEFVDNFVRYYRASVVTPLEYATLLITIISLYLTIFNTTIQQAWWRWARFALLVPFTTIILLLPTYQSGGGFITFGGTSDLVILWGVVFAIATLIYTLYQRFYVQRGITYKREANQDN